MTDTWVFGWAYPTRTEFEQPPGTGTKDDAEISYVREAADIYSVIIDTDNLFVAVSKISKHPEFWIAAKDRTTP